jgi:butyrate kinase
MSGSNFLSDMNSEQSRDDGDLEEYKKIIQIMTVEMNEVCQIVKERDAKIEKMEALVKRLEKELRDVK